MSRAVLTTSLIAALAVTSIAAPQVNSALSGILSDSSGAGIPGARVTAENTSTGVVSSTTANEVGVYNFPSLLPGVYRVSAEYPGFQKVVYAEVHLEVAGRAVLNFQLQLSPTEATLEVSTPLDASLTVGDTSVGGVITDQRLLELPGPGNDPRLLVRTQAGVQGSNFAGARIGALNVTRDGINISDQFLNLGLNSPLFNSVEIIQETRVITSPADAELGRGSGQVQILTRGGTNEFHGSIFEWHNDTALNANNWFNNLRGTPRDPHIYNEFGGRLGGPIIRSRTFFQFLYQGKREVFHNSVSSLTYTSSARQGLFRFFPGAQNQNASGMQPAVDVSGNPVRPVSAIGDLMSVNVFGRDPNRPGPDRTGIVQNMFNLMPLPNDFRLGDGLNTAGFRWSRPLTFNENHVDFRIDHVMRQRHNVSLTFARQTDNDVNLFMPQPYPDSPAGKRGLSNHLFSLGITSTLSPALVNEFRTGAQLFRYRFQAPWESETGRSMLPAVGGHQYLPSMLITPPVDLSNDPQGRISPLYVYADTLSWTNGRHVFKGGSEVRFASARPFSSTDVMPRAVFGSVASSPVVGLNEAAIPGLGLNATAAQGLLNQLSGSLSSIRQAFNATGSPELAFVPGEGHRRTWKRKEFAFFLKDDLKVRPSLTLNIGMRYEYYGVPFEALGKAAGLVGESKGIFGITGTDWADLYQPGRMNGSLTQVQLLGKNSPNPTNNLYSDDWNNLAPAVGLSWSIPYFGKDKTVLRLGYSVGYELNAFGLIDLHSGRSVPGLRTTTTYSPSMYLDLTGVNLPLAPVGRPLETVPLTDRVQTVATFDSNLRTPYFQNWNLSIQRYLARDFRLDVRYVGNKGTKLVRGTDINEVNIFETGIVDAFRTTQAGGDSPLFDRIFQGLNLGLGVINGQAVTASASLRSNATTQTYFANNLVGAFAGFVNNTNSFTGVRGGLLRRANLPENYIVANPQFGAAVLIGNFANSTYHSLQVDLNKRFSNGFTFQSNLTWSKTLGEEEGVLQSLTDAYRDTRRRYLDKRLLSFHRSYAIHNSGTFELPFGPGKLFFKNHGVLSRLLERWQIGVLNEVVAGAPLDLISGVSPFSQYSDTPDLIGSLPKGRVARVSDGVVYFPEVVQVADPAVAPLTNQQGLRDRSILRAIADSSGRPLLVNPQPGHLGRLAPMSARGPSTLALDVDLLKRIAIGEHTEFVFRVDALGVFNRPQFGNPVNDINSPTFGRITSATGNRAVGFSARINF
jgi:hypothetical protein